MKIKVNFKCLLLFGMFLISSIVWNPVLAQIPPEAAMSININTPAKSASVPSGDLTIYGTSSDDDTKNCQVYADWNDMKPMQSVTPNGPKGNADYSKWSFTYTDSYYNIVEGPNELTSKITCYGQGQNASSNFYSINVTGTKEGSEIANDTLQQSNENTDNEVTNISPVKTNISKSTNDTVQQSNENTDNEVTNISPVKANISKGKYKILPLYSGSNEEVANSISSEDDHKTEVTSTETSKPQDAQNLAAVGDTNTKSLSSEDQEEIEVTSTETSKPQDAQNLAAIGDTNTKSLSSEEQEEIEVTSTDTGEFPDSHKSAAIGDTNTKSLSSEEQEEIEETTAYDNSKSQVAESIDEELDTDTNTYFTFEPDLQEDEHLSNNGEDPTTNNADSDGSPANHYEDGNSVFGKLKGLNEDKNGKEKLEERPADSMRVFGITG
jgi:hypothetical protein